MVGQALHLVMIGVGVEARCAVGRTGMTIAAAWLWTLAAVDEGCCAQQHTTATDSTTEHNTCNHLQITQGATDFFGDRDQIHYQYLYKWMLIYLYILIFFQNYLTEFEWSVVILGPTA